MEEKGESSTGHDSFDYDNSDGSDHTAQTVFGNQLFLEFCIIT